MKKLMLTLIFILLLPITVTEITRGQQKTDALPEMTTYYVGLLSRGPKWTPEVTPEVEGLQKEHLANIRRLMASGKLILAGPFTDGGKLRGIFVFQVASQKEAEELANSDPAVQAGRLIVEIHPWFAPKGIRFDQAAKSP